MAHKILTLAEALREGMESEGRALDAILAEAFAKRGLPAPVYNTYPDGTPRCAVRHPTAPELELSLTFHQFDPVYYMDLEPQAILAIHRDPHMVDWVTLVMHGSGKDGTNRQQVTGPFHNNARPLYEGYLAGVEGASAPFIRWEDQQLGYAHFHDREKALTIARWMVEHFFTLQ